MKDIKIDTVKGATYAQIDLEPPDYPSTEDSVVLDLVNALAEHVGQERAEKAILHTYDPRPGLVRLRLVAWP